MTRRFMRPHLLFGLLLGCTTRSGDEGGGPSEQDEGVGPLGGTVAGEGEGEGEEASLPRPPAVGLPRGLGHDDRITEVWLDPRASAALSLDAAGSVRLWPRLPTANSKLEEVAPIRVPIREPRSLSFARSATNAYVIAALDTGQTARVIEIEIDERGQAGVRERFALHPSDPLLELHVLDGGDRLLALGVDHRLRLYDGHGKLVSELTEYGLAPWQLRFAGPPEALQVAMVLAGPTRIQRLSLAGDRIERVGQPHPILLDRGPNQNDLALLPSGKQVAVLRRPEVKGKHWSLELHDLDTGAVRLLWGQVESDKRPRLHVVDDQRALLEDGSGKVGWWIDLRGGAAMPEPFVLPATVAELPPEGLTQPAAIAMPGLDRYDPRQVSVVAGVRIVPIDREILLDPIDGDRHHRLGHRGLSLRDHALDLDGSALAMAMTEGPVVVASLTDRTEHPVACTTEPLEDIEFSDRDHLLLVDKKRARICAWKTGEVVSEVELPENFRETRIHLGEPGAGRLGAGLRPPPEMPPEETGETGETEAGEEPESPNYDYPLIVSQVSFADNRFGEFEPVAKADLAAWIDLDPDSGVLALDHQGARYSRAELNTDHFDLVPVANAPPAEQRPVRVRYGKKRKVVVSERNIQIESLAPSPDGRFIAIAHVPGFEVSEDYGEYYSHGYYGGYGGYVANLIGGPAKSLTLWSIAGEIPEPKWSAAVERTLDLSWSGDGSRIAVFEDARIRVLTPEGELVDERSTRDFHVEELADPPPPPPPEPAPAK